MARPRLTILVLARDSARKLERILENLRAVADELVIAVDSESRDDSPEVARRWADKVVTFPHDAVIPDTGSTGPGIDEYVLPHCAGEWILRVDHDETLGPEWRNEALLESILCDRRVTHVRVPKRWAAGNGEVYIRNRHWTPDDNVRLFRNIPSILRAPRVWHEDLYVQGEGRLLAEAYLIHWTNVWDTREERVNRVLFYARRSKCTSQELYLYEYQPHEKAPLYEPLPDPVFEADYPAGWNPRFRVAVKVLRGPQSMFAGERAALLVGIHNGTSRWLHPHSELAPTGTFLSYRWWDEAMRGEPPMHDGERWVLPRSIAPGEHALAWLRVCAPQRPGMYRLEPDLVEEQVSWFGAPGGLAPSRVAVLLPPRANWYPDLPPDLR